MTQPPNTPPRQLHLNVNILHSGFVPSAWRLADADPQAFIDVRHYVRVAQIAEAAGFDAVFLADNASIADQIDFRPITALEPTILLASIAAATSHIGVIGTASTSYNEPYNIARRFATLDHVSGGRAGWNVVTTADLGSARNFGRDAVPDHAERYARAAEFTSVVKALWDSWEDGAVIGDKTSGLFVDTDQGSSRLASRHAFLGAGSVECAAFAARTSGAGASRRFGRWPRACRAPCRGGVLGLAIVRGIS